METRHRILSVATSVVALTSLTLSSCARHSEPQAIAPAPATAPSGSVGTVSASSSIRSTRLAARGAILDARIGGTAGALISARMDRQATEGIQVTLESGLLYDTDSDVVRAEARKSLRALAASLNKWPGSDVLVVGHTDQVGPAAYNLSLSERRAAAAADYLVVNGVKKDRVSTRGMGEREPIAEGTTERGRELNRRVEIAIFASPEYRAEVALH